MPLSVGVPLIVPRTMTSPTKMPSLFSRCANKPAVTALREIAKGQVRYNESVETTVNQFLVEKKSYNETTKRKRGTN